METFVEREKYLINVQNEILKGGISVQDWTTFQLESKHTIIRFDAHYSQTYLCAITQ